MKRVFAFLSAFVLALALIGTSIQAADVEPAPGKFIVDPTLTDDEIPMYVMDSIYTTFPNHYDNVAKPDSKYQTGRLYPWNESKLWVPQYEAGEPTGKMYSIYWVGGLNYQTADGAPISQAGNNRHFVVASDVGGVWKTTAAQSAPASASLSFLRMNNTGNDVWFDTTHEPNNNAHVSYLVFDEDGKAIRGIAPASSIENKYCYAVAGGLIEVDENNTGCEMLLDGESNPTGPKYFLGRIVWDSQINPTDHPTMFNNGYLSTDWSAHKWDNYDETSGVAWSFYAGGDGNFGAMTTDEIAFHNLQPANAANQLAAGARRDVVRYFNFPDQGFFYSFAFLDRGTALMTHFRDMYWTGMKHGRDAEYAVQFKTYDFSAQAVVPANFGALIPMESVAPTTIEVLKDSTFIPRNNLNFDALGRYWGVPDSFTGFVSDLNVLEHTVAVNGATVSMPSLWANKADMITEFYADWNTWACANRAAEYCEGGTIGPITPANAYAQRYSMFSETAGGNFWWGKDSSAPAKWMFLISYVSSVRASQTPPLAVTTFNTTTLAATGTSTSTATVMQEILNYFAETHRTAWPASSNYTVGYTTLPPSMAVGGIRGLGSLTYSIDTTGKAPGYVYNVDYQVKNTVSEAVSTLRLKYVVTQVYTPRIQINQLGLLKSQGEAFDIRSIATATDGYGNDISQYLVFSSDKEINPKSLAAGTYRIQISVVDQHFGIKQASKVVYLKAADLTAPLVTTRNLVLPFGALFNIRDGFVTAYDNLDGNLLGAQDYNPFVEMSDPIPANRAGTYVVEYEVYDRTGNSAMGVFTVKVLPDYHTQIMDKLNTLGTTAQVNAMKAELLTALAALETANEADLEAVKTQLTTLLGTLGTDVAGVNTSVNGVKAHLEALINDALADLEVTVVEKVDAIPAQDNTASIVTGSVSTVSSLGVGAGIIMLLLRRR